MEAMGADESVRIIVIRKKLTTVTAASLRYRLLVSIWNTKRRWREPIRYDDEGSEDAVV